VSKYRTKINTVDAVQWDPSVKIKGIRTIKALSVNWECPNCGRIDADHGMLKRHPYYEICPGSWIVTWENGMKSIVTDAEFKANFEKVEEVIE
jgi:rubredoxin